MLPMQKAKYLAKAIGCSFGIASTKTYQVGIPVEVVDHPELTGESITWIGHFTDATQDRTIESLQNFGWKGDDLSELEELDADGAARVLPDVVEIVVEPETYDGKLQLRVKWINKPGAGRFAFKERLAGAQLKAFAAQMKGAIRGARAGGAPSGQTKIATGTTQRSGQPHPNAPGSRDDIPF